MEQCFTLFNLTPAPTLLYSTWKDFADVPRAASPESNFLKGVQWSPDGVCLLTATDDKRIRIYDLPEEAHITNSYPQQAHSEATHTGTHQPHPTAHTPHSTTPHSTTPHSTTPAAPASPLPLGHATPPLALGLCIPQGETVYDYQWYPGMTAADPATCCFVTATRAHPVRLWDACGGQLRCTYRSYNNKDEIVSPYSVAFSCTRGEVLLVGLNKEVHVFDVQRPGRDCVCITTGRRKNKAQEGLAGLIGSLACNPQYTGTFAAGCYDGSVGVYDYSTREQLLQLEGHTGGVTQVLWSRDGSYLYSGARKDPHIYCWDVRYALDAVYCMLRDTATTNQRVCMDIEGVGRHLVTGGEHGQVDMFDLRDGSKVGTVQAARDTVNGVHLHPYLPLMATASGHRRYSTSSTTAFDSSDDDEEEEGEEEEEEGEEEGAHDAHGMLRASVTAPMCSSNNSSDHNDVQEDEHGIRRNVLNVWQLATHVEVQHVQQQQEELL